MPEKKSIFTPSPHVDKSLGQKNMKLTSLMLLYGLHLCFNFDKIRFVNGGFITEKNFGTKKARKVFLAPSTKTSDRIQ